jgi:hypothetical protein
MAPTPDATGLSDEHDRLVLPVHGNEVSQISVDYAFTLTLGSVSIRIEQPFVVTRHGETRTYEPEDILSLGTLLDLHKAVVHDGYARKDGVLVLNFDDGAILAVEPHPQYEAFVIDGIGQIHSESRFTLAAMAGGGLARW